MIQDITLKMISYFGNDVKRINHALKVYSFAKTIAEAEHIDSRLKTIVEITGLIHDIGIHQAELKYGSSAGNYQEIEGPDVAKTLLQDLEIDTDILERVLFIIGHHHTLSKIDNLDFQILVEADFIVNIFEDEFSKKSVELILLKHIKTKTAQSIIRSMYL